MWIVLTVLLAALPGALGDDYNAGGLVAAAAVSFLMLFPIIALIVILIKWRNWYMKRQARRGFYRVPRRHWSTFKKRVTKSKTTHLTHISTPRSEHRQQNNKTTDVVRTYNVGPVQQSDNRNILVNTTAVNRTLAAQGPAYGTAYQEKGKYVINRYEEKAQTMDLEEEEEPTFVADVLPDDHVTRKTTVTQFMSQTRADTPPPPPSYDNVALRQTTVTQPQPSLSQTRTETRTETYYTQPESTELRATTVPPPVTQQLNENDYHVRLLTDDEMSRDHTPVHFGATTRSVDERDRNTPVQTTQTISQTIKEHYGEQPYTVREEPEDETGMRTTVVRLGYPEQDAAAGHMGKTYHGNEAYRVNSGGTRLAQTTRDGRDIIIAPSLGATTSEGVTYSYTQASTSQRVDGGGNVTRFAMDSDDEAGNIPTTRLGQSSRLY